MDMSCASGLSPGRTSLSIPKIRIAGASPTPPGVDEALRNAIACVYFSGTETVMLRYRMIP
jgi:hypothetical protein